MSFMRQVQALKYSLIMRIGITQLEVPRQTSLLIEFPGTAAKLQVYSYYNISYDSRNIEDKHCRETTACYLKIIFSIMAITCSYLKCSRTSLVKLRESQYIRNHNESCEA